MSPIATLREATLTFGADKKYATFDRTGRLLFYTEPGLAIRRGLDHRMVESSEGPSGRSYRDLSEAEKKALIEALRSGIHLQWSADGVEDRLRRKLEQIEAWTPEQLALDHDQFHSLYRPISILPPDQYRSLVVQVAEGCSYNRCLFCDFYRDRPFHIKSDQELSNHLSGIKAFFGERLIDRSGIFLGDGNALVIPTERLLSFLQKMKLELPPALFQSGIATFMDTFSLERKSLEELRILRDAGMQAVYVGFETGADSLREFLRKQGTAQEALSAMTTLKQAGYQLAVIILVGAGGREFADRHVKDTLSILAKLPLQRGDLIYLSPFVEPVHTGYTETATSAGLESLPEEKLNEEYEFIRQALQSMHPEAKVTRYSILQHLY